MKNILIATCGTSILTNARDIKNEVLGEREYSSITSTEAEEVKRRILLSLKDKIANDRECGAEVNSTYYLIEKNDFSKERLILIVSDSPDGMLAGEIIKETMIEKLNIKNVEIRKIENLNITREHDFAIKGLRNLATEIANILNKENVNDIAISPIGGLKAQIFIVGLMAQLFKVPAYYLYENSTEIVKLLPLPISLDMEFFKENLDIITKISKNSALTKPEIDSYLKANPELKNVLEEVHVDDETLYSLSPLGEMAYGKLVSFSQNYLPREATPEEKVHELGYKNNEAHCDQVRNTPRFQKFIRAIIEAPYVIKVRLNYYNPKNKGNIIKITKSSNELEGRVLKFHFNMKQGMVEGDIYLTENEDDKATAALIDLQSIVIDL